jgi:hypothetical protein
MNPLNGQLVYQLCCRDDLAWAVEALARNWAAAVPLASE